MPAPPALKEGKAGKMITPSFNSTLGPPAESKELELKWGQVSGKFAFLLSGQLLLSTQLWQFQPSGSVLVCFGSSF